MKNVGIIVALLFGSAGIAKACGTATDIAGRIGIAAVFAFTALGHFMKRDEMTAMLPPSIPSRSAIVVLSGLFEACLAIFVLVPVYSKVSGIAICAFLVLVTPVNVYAAIMKVDFGGHAGGPRYLLVRLPLQIVLFSWTYWFVVRTP